MDYYKKESKYTTIKIIAIVKMLMSKSVDLLDIGFSSNLLVSSNVGDCSKSIT